MPRILSETRAGGSTIQINRSLWKRLIELHPGEIGIDLASRAIAEAVNEEKFTPCIIESNEKDLITIRLRVEAYKKLKEFKSRKFRWTPLCVIGESAIAHTLEKAGKTNAN